MSSFLGGLFSSKTKEKELREQPLNPSLRESLLGKMDAPPTEEEIKAALTFVQNLVFKDSVYTTPKFLKIALDAMCTSYVDTFSPATLDMIIDECNQRIKGVIQTSAQLKETMASTLISEVINRTDRETPLSQKQIEEKITELFERFSEIISSMGLKTAVNSPEKKINFILDLTTFPMSHPDLRKDRDGSFKAILATLRKENLPSSTAFAGAVGAAGGATAGAGGPGRATSSSDGSSTEASPGSSPAPGVTG